MTYHFEQNEFTSWELLEYLKKVYGTKMNGSPFTATDLNNWRRLKAIPQLYGGYKIISAVHYEELGNLLVFTLDSLTRAMVDDVVGSVLEGMRMTKNLARRADTTKKTTRPRKIRTDFYYKLLPAHLQTTKSTLRQSMVPLFYKEAGGKANQLVIKKRSKKKPL